MSTQPNTAPTTLHYTSWQERLTSPFTAYPHSYAATSPDDIEAIHSVLHHASTELSDLEHSIQLLNDEKHALEKLIAKHRRYLHPISRIPPETWIEIFKIACNFHLQYIWSEVAFPVVFCRTSSNRGPWDTLNPVVMLTQVCSSWRSTLHACPEMWTSLFFGDHAWTQYPGRMSKKEYAEYMQDPAVFAAYRLRRLSDILDFSKNLPLRISYNRPSARVREDADAARPLINDTLQTLLRHQHRWKRLDLYDVFYHSASLISACIIQCGVHGPEFPALEELNFSGSLSYPYDSGIEDYNRLIELLGRLPSLRRAFFIRKCPNPTWLPWGQLERITLDRIASSEWHSIHPFLVNAIEIKMVQLEYEGYRPPNEPYILPSLEIFHVDHWARILLGFPTFPRLRALHFGDDANADDIANFIQRSQCKITRFVSGTMNGIGNRWSAPIVPKLLPYLRILKFNRCCRDQTEALMSHLSCKSGTHGSFLFCSELRYLRLGRGLGETKDNWILSKNVVDMIKARWEVRTTSGGLLAVGCIPRSPAWWMDEDKEEFRIQFERVKEMEKEGLKVEWSDD